MKIPLSKKNLSLIFFILLVLVGVFFLTHFNRDWSVAADQEFTLAYNATLINSGMNQDYYDHPGFFTIQFIALLLKLSSILGLTSVKSIGELNQFTPLFDGFTQITIAARFLAISSVTLIVIGWFFIILKIIKNSWLALAITGCIFTSGSLTIHYSQLRTEPIAFILLSVSVFFLSRVFLIQDSKKIVLFFLVILFFFLGALNKTQIIFYAPVYYLWAICCFSESKANHKTPYEHLTQALLALLSITICWHLSSFNAIAPSQYFNALFILSIYFIIFIYWMISGGNLAGQITLFNIFFIASFLMLQISLKSFGANASELLKQIQSPLVMLMFAGQKVQGVFSTSTHIHTFDVHVIANFILSPIQSVLGSLNTQSIFFWGDITLWIFLRKHLHGRENISVVASLISFFIIIIISSARSLQPQYILFSECFLIFAFILLISKAPDLRFKWLVIMVLAVAIFYTGFIKLWADLNNTGNQYKLLCDPKNDYMRWWHSKLDYQKFLSECKAKGF